jgi:outer membrane protein, heavy metal efflux system
MLTSCLAFVYTAVITVLSASALLAAEPKLNVDRLVDEALRNNPEILAAREKAEAAREKIPQAYSLDDPMLGVGVTNLPTTFSFKDDEMTQKEITISQKLPFPGKRGLMAEVAEKEADASLVEVEEIANRITREVKTVYFDLSHVDRTLAVTHRNKQVLESLVRIGEARYSLGQGAQQEVLAAHVEISKMVDEILMLEQNRLALEAKLAALLNREPEGRFGEIEDVAFRKQPIDIKRLQETAVETNPMLKSLREMVAARQKAVALAEREVYPDLTLKLGYGQRDDLRDMVSGMAEINVPIFYATKQSPKIAEARADVRTAEARYRAARNEIASMVASMATMVQRQERQVDLYESGILPQARLLTQSAMSAYSVNKSEFGMLLESHIRQHRYELDYHQALTEHEKNLAQLEYAVGRPLRAGEGRP